MMAKQDFSLELLAELEHIQWQEWTKYFLENLTPKNIKRWKRQVKTAYAKLSEKEKESDRFWARRAYNLMNGCAICGHRFIEETTEVIYVKDSCVCKSCVDEIKGRG